MDATPINPLPLSAESTFETIALLKQVAQAHRYLAELKGIAKTIPNENILISTLILQEAKDSSEIENIFTTHDQLFQAGLQADKKINQAAKEVENYRESLWMSYRSTRETGLIRLEDILHLHSIIEPSKAGIRKLPGTVIGNSKTKEVIYTPPQHHDDIKRLLANLVDYLNDDGLSSLDPLIKMAIAHHQFESIHPFYDGNGRAGRILNILYLVKSGLLDQPVLYLSRYIVRTKGDYYRLLQSVRDDNNWSEWIAYMVKGVEITARETIQFIIQMRDLIMATKRRMRAELPKIYSQELLNNLFFHPYTKVDFVVEQVGVSRITATKYLNELVEHNFVFKKKLGRTNYFINTPLVELIIQQEQISL